MKTDLYTKIILTVIAANLSMLSTQSLDLFESKETAYALVPVNEDGSIDVRIKSSEEIDVEITGVSTYDELHVDLSEISTSDVLEVDIEKVSGYSVSRGIPVLVED